MSLGAHPVWDQDAAASAAPAETTAAARSTELAADENPEGCGYGQGGPSDTTLCWIDMSGLDVNQARQPAGQDMSITLPGGNTLSFTAKITQGPGGFRSIAATRMPTWSGTIMGSAYYQNTPGQPALYQDNGTNGPGVNTIVTLDDLTMRGSNGSVSTDYSMIMADAESTNGNEGLQFGSDTSIEVFDRATPEGPPRPAPAG